MVGGGAHSANAVESSRETRGDSSLEIAIAIAVVIDTLEEFEGSWVRRVGRVQGFELLDSDVGVANNFTTLKGLRGGIVGRSGV